MTETFYDILGVAPQADLDTIRSAYRKLALKYHPDLNPTLEDAVKSMIRINLAYETLSSSVRRSEYDSSLSSGGSYGGGNYHTQGGSSWNGHEIYIERKSGAIRVKITPVIATSIRSVGYDFKSRTLVVHFYNGGLYWYEDVPNKLYQKMMSAPDIGRYFSLNIAYRYPSQRV